MALYNETVMDHFENPRNAGKMDDADAIGTVGSPACGDVMKIYIKVDPEQNVLEKVSFLTYGCGTAIACSSIMTELVKGRSLDSFFEEGKSKDDLVMKLKEEIVSEMGEIPAIKIHCSILAADGLYDALEKYQNREKK